MLKNTYSKLVSGEKLTVAYFGGSITEGAGSTDKKTKGWRSHTTNWLRATYPESEIVEVNATIGGTGSDLGVFRMDEDVLRYSPDLLFIEFATNDTAFCGCEEYEEAIVRRVLKNSPKTDIVLVLTCTRAIFEKQLRGEYSDSYVSYHVLADRYGLPLVDIGEEINTRVRAGEGDYMTYTKDSVHPNDLGHTLLAAAAIRFLARELTLPLPVRHEKYEGARLINASEIKDTDFEYVDEDFVGESGKRGHGYLFASRAEQHIKVRFVGTTVGAIYLTAHDSGDVKWRIDGGEYKTKRLWDEYALRFDRVNYVVFDNTLAEGEHTLEIVSTGQTDARADGANVKISAIMVS